MRSQQEIENRLAFYRVTLERIKGKIVAAEKMLSEHHNKTTADNLEKARVHESITTACIYELEWVLEG